MDRLVLSCNRAGQPVAECVLAPARQRAGPGTGRGSDPPRREPPLTSMGPASAAGRGPRTGCAGLSPGRVLSSAQARSPRRPEASRPDPYLAMGFTSPRKAADGSSSWMDDAHHAAVQAARWPGGVYPAGHQAVAGRQLPPTIRSSSWSYPGIGWTPARSSRLTRIMAIVTISASSMIPADTSNPREKPTASA
jgi:hypothetical protein